MTSQPARKLDECLAYAVVRAPSTWLGYPSPTHLSLFLKGAAERVYRTSASVSEWQVFGPLERAEFYLPIVARTGHPTLSIKWATALELIYFDLNAAMRELQALIESHDDQALVGLERPLLSGPTVGSRDSLMETLRKLARRPAMFLGQCSGWALRSYLAGMHLGGDWLRLPQDAELTRIVTAIEHRSIESYGSPFAAYRVCDAQELLGSAGIEPNDS